MEFGKEQTVVARLLAGGAPVIACPFGMKVCGVDSDDLLPGVIIASFEIVDSLLFSPEVRVLNW